MTAQQAEAQEAMDARRDREFWAVMHFIEENPTYKDTALALIRGCQEERESRELFAAVDDELSGQLHVQKSSSIANALVRKGALVSQTYIDGEPATQEQLEALDPESTAVVEYRIAATAGASAVLEALDPNYLVQDMYLAHAEAVSAFDVLLEAMSLCDGLTREEVDELLDDSPCLQRDEHGLPRFYPSYFLNLLRVAGGVEWDGKWRITESGRALYAQRKQQ